MLKKDIANNAPTTPGIYIFWSNKKPIYVGMSGSLKGRLLSYFAIDLLPKTRAMISKADQVTLIKTATEFDALILEAELIKKHQPKYNIISKDGKGPLYIITTKEEFPRLLIVRRPIQLKTRLEVGPFIRSSLVFTALKFLRKSFPYCEHSIQKKPCLNAQMGLCMPCPSWILSLTDPDERNYQKGIFLRNIKYLERILKGKSNSLIDELTKQMDRASSDEDFENAVIFRNQIQALLYLKNQPISASHYLNNPNLELDLRQKEVRDLEAITTTKASRIECFDISHLGGTDTTASMVTFIDGEPAKKLYRHYRVRVKSAGNDLLALSEIASRRKSKFDLWGRPDLIIVDGGIGQVNTFRKVIKDIPIVGIAKNPDRLVFTSETKVRLRGHSANLVSRLRDEAHRFARKYHHALYLKRQ